MSLGLWTLSYIKTKIRNLTQTPDESQLSDTNLVNYINRYYQLVLPYDLRPQELNGWFQFDTVDGISEYSLATQTDSASGRIFEDEIVSIELPCTLDGYDIRFYLNPEEFYTRWAETETYDEAQPTGVLYYDEKLTFRNPPDDAYTFKISAWKRPAAFANASPTTEYPLMEEWGKLIAYGTAREIFEDNGDVDGMSRIEQLYELERTKLSRKASFQNINQRAIPSF